MTTVDTSRATPATTTVSLRDGRYVLDRQLGRGGFSITWRAADHRLGRWVAIKQLVPPPAVDASAARARFQREAQVLARFDHPGIVRVFEAFEEGNAAYLVTEYLHGRTLSEDLLARGRVLTEQEALALAGHVGHALTTVHAAGLLHRDVSPSNIVLAHGDGGPRPVLIDFGLARRYGPGATVAMTRMVTPGFAPLEQYSEGDAGPMTDIYGLAATMYHGLGGRLPAGAVERQAGAQLEPLRRLRPDVSRVVCDAVHDGLELAAAHRPQDVATFLARLGLGEELAPRPARPSRPAEPAPIPESASDRGPLAPRSDADSPGVKADWRRRSVTWPVVALAAAIGAAAPVAGVVALVLVVLPLLATTGDVGRRRHHPVRAALVAPVRLARNVVATVEACAIPLVIAGSSAIVGLLGAPDVIVAGGGAVAGGFAVATVGIDRARFAAGDVIDAWVRRDEAPLVSVTLAVLAAVGAFALRPELWPLV